MLVGWLWWIDASCPRLSGWFDVTWHTDPAVLGSMVFVCNLVAGFSALFAAKLAELIGLIQTMAFTHLPSNILLILVPLMPKGMGQQA